MKKKRAAVGLAMIGLLGVVAPEAQAVAPVLQGSTLTTSGIRFGCEGAYCTAFRLAGCPGAMAKADGATTSIVDVSGLGNQTLTFTWSDVVGGLGTDLSSSLHFYAVSSCDYDPTGFPNALPVALTLTTRAPTKDYKIPVGTKWLIAEPTFHSTGVTWSAS